MTASTPVNSPQPVAKPLAFLVKDFRNVVQKASSAISSSLRSCDDASEALAGNNELVVRRRGDFLLAPQRSESLSAHLASLSNNSKPFEAQYWGDHQFQVSMKWCTSDGKISPEDPQFGGSIAISAWTETHQGKRCELPVTVKWLRRCGTQTIPVEYTGLSLPVTADDVCCYLRAQVTAVSDDRGTATCEMGPFDIDAAMRNTVQGYLHAMGTRFPVDPVESVDNSISDTGTLDGSDGKSYVLFVSADEIRLMKPGPKNVGFVREWSAPIAAFSNIVYVDYSTPKGLKLVMKQSPDHLAEKIRVAALSTRQRDTIVLTIRAFAAMKVVNASTLLEQIAVNTCNNDRSFKSHTGDKELQFPDGVSPEMTSDTKRTELDFYLVYDQLNRQLNESLETTRQAVKDRRRAVSERDLLEEDLNDTILGYQKMLEEYRNGGGNDREGRPPGSSLTNSNPTAQEVTQRAALVAQLTTELREAREQLEKSEEQCSQLKRNVRDWKEKYAKKDADLKVWLESGSRKPRQDLDASGFGEDDPMRIIELQNQIRELEALNLTLKSDVEKGNSYETGQRSLKDELEAAQRQIRSLGDTIDKIRLEKETAEENAQWLKHKLDELNNKVKKSGYQEQELNEQMNRTLRQKEKEVAHERNKAADLELQIRQLQRELGDLKGEEGRLRQANQTLHKRLDSTQRILDEKVKDIANLNQTLLMEPTRRLQQGMDATHVTTMSSDEKRQLELRIHKLEEEKAELTRKVFKLSMAE